MDATHRLLTALLVAAALTSACGGGGDPEGGDDADGGPTSPPSSTTEAPAAPATDEADEGGEEDDRISPARAQLDWVVGFLNDGGEVTVDEIEAQFSPTFLAQISAEQLVASLPNVVALAEPPFVVERADEGADGLSIEAVLVGADDRRLAATVLVDDSEPNLILGLQIVPTELAFPAPIEIGAIDGRLMELGSQSSLGVYDVTGGDCVAVHDVRTETLIVLGSIFKLWVLAALAIEIEEGRATWDETVAVTDELRSTPDGEIYELATGTEVTLQRLARAMISLSDNTATDLLLDRLGRPAVEAAMERSGVADPAANRPMLSTGNLFALKFVADPPNAADYRVLDEAGRRELLDGLDDAVLPWVGEDVSQGDFAESVNADGVPIFEPRDLDVEWFATAGDLCRTLVFLDELAERPGLEPVASILETNPGRGIPFDRDRWPTIRFKGGSEPGVVAVAWWFEGSEGDAYVVAGGVADPEAAVDVIDASLTIGSAIELIE